METFFKLEKGVKVNVGGHGCVIDHVLDSETFVVVDFETGDRRRIDVSEIDDISDSSVPVDMLEDPERKEAYRRFNIIAPVLRAQLRGGREGRVKRVVDEVCSKEGVSKSTVYSWIKEYSFSERISALAPEKKGPIPGTTLLSEEREQLLTDVIEKEYLTAKRKSVTHTIDSAERAFRAAGLDFPHPNTIRNRIRALNRRFCAALRSGNMMKKRPLELFRENPNLGPEAAGVYQIDHTPIDAILVDDVYRQPIGRPWITLAMSPVTRVVAGIYISFDPPGDVSVGQCMVNMILPKRPYLEELGLADELSWPMWGLPTGVHADNAKEFRGNLLQDAALNYQYRIEWRCVKKPEYGAHVERILGTILKKVHDIPGTTFSNIQERAEYDSDGNAIMTLLEFEQWLMYFILKSYHLKVHPALGVSPLDKFNEVIFGTNETPGRGIPIGVSDPRRLKIDFLPSIRRSVTQAGVVIDQIHYSADALSPWIGRGSSDEVKTHVFKRDPRCISPIYFYDPAIEDYIEIPFRDRTKKPMSIWELREARKILKDKGRNKATEAEIFDTHGEMLRLIDQAADKTKSARKALQARKVRERKIKTYSPEDAKEMPPEMGHDVNSPSSETVETILYDLDEEDDYEPTIRE